ncbi:Hypothetical protein LEPBI_I1689 [Leptospira biflexa serovar Patoc strain 'Patoc 1 (Paris)']|uniref:Uncharacterized protein n=1 Tax=Leptospira biflexa serovar Patoc (strain Patoc 1 / ATCC 23582 / Paris) TaxID=456481 RepID=B0SRK1_LEPBP|nr:Hypothetical protein LEPBI_I1689 [Leptospira biflexa serovar Patoc strain 'Patoc 1 (Paris)']
MVSRDAESLDETIRYVRLGFIFLNRWFVCMIESFPYLNLE